MNFGRQSLLAAVFTLALTATTSRGGWFGQGESGNSDEQLLRAVGLDRSFTATATVSVKDKKDRETYAADVDYAVLKGKMRTEIDMTRMKLTGKRSEGAAAAASMGLGRMVHIFRPDKKLTWIVYPGLKGYCELPAGPKGTDTNAVAPKVTRIELGKETVDGHPCVKSKVTIVTEAGGAEDILVWEATDLNKFPIQTRIETGRGDTVTTRFHEIKEVAPDANLFEIPPGCKPYASMQEMMMSSMQQLMQPQDGGRGEE